jgi:hypothetical protein
MGTKSSFAKLAGYGSQLAWQKEVAYKRDPNSGAKRKVFRTRRILFFFSKTALHNQCGRPPAPADELPELWENGKYK